MAIVGFAPEDVQQGVHEVISAIAPATKGESDTALVASGVARSLLSRTTLSRGGSDFLP